MFFAEQTNISLSNGRSRSAINETDIMPRCSGNRKYAVPIPMNEISKTSRNKRNVSFKRTFASKRDSNTIIFLDANKSYKTVCFVDSVMKQAIVVSKDVKMDKGKLCVQVAHASVSAALKVKNADPELFDKWFTFGQKKVVLKVDNTKQLLDLRKKASAFKVQSELIKDAGLTQLIPGTITALGIGPAEDEDIDRIIHDLKLL